MGKIKLRQNLTPEEDAFFKSGFGAKASIQIGTDDQGCGYFVANNSFGTKVVSVESNKKNEGAIYLYNVNGEIGNVVTSRP